MRWPVSSLLFGTSCGRWSSRWCPGVEPAATGRPRVSDRAALTAVLFVLFTGVPWKLVSREFGVSGSTAHQRFTAWARAGVFEPLHAELLRRLNQAGGIDGSTGVIDGSHLRALQRGL